VHLRVVLGVQEKVGILPWADPCRLEMGVPDGAWPAPERGSQRLRNLLATSTISDHPNRGICLRMLSVSLCCEILMPSHSNRPNPHRQNPSHQFRDLVPTGFNELWSQGLFPYRVRTRFLPRELQQPYYASWEPIHTTMTPGPSGIQKCAGVDSG